MSGPTGDPAVTAAAGCAGTLRPVGVGPGWLCGVGVVVCRRDADRASVALALGESATCTIVNDDIAASLTLVKQVVNDNGGTAAATDWTLSAAGPTAGVTGPTGDPAVTAAAVAAGTYDLSESGPVGYAASGVVV